MADASRSSNSPTPSQTGEKKLLPQLPNDEFLPKIELFLSRQVTIRVEGRDFRLPKDLLCYSSTFFDRKLNGDENGSGGENIVCVLPYGSLETFGLVVQWIYTTSIVLPTLQQHLLRRQSDEAAVKKEKTNVNAVDLTIEGASSVPTNNIFTTDQLREMNESTYSITSYVQFFILAEKIGLLGPFSSIIRKVKSILCQSESPLLPEHIRIAAELPRGHELRKLFAQACVGLYIADVKVQPTRDNFRFKTEMNEVESFAADLLHEYDFIARQGKMEWKNGGLHFVYKDPLTGKPQRLLTWTYTA